jgi:hypothetical protein
MLVESPSLPIPTSSRGFSVADLCARWRIGADKIHGFLRRGELIGINVATNLSGRPQWRITPESVAAFEQRRTSASPPKPVRRRRKAETIDFYPDDD